MKIRLEFKLQDLWIGAFWRTTYRITDEGEQPFSWDLWICLIPCLPIRLTKYYAITIPL